MAQHSIYPARPRGSTTLLKVSGNQLTLYDRLVVIGSSLFFVGGIFWVPALYAYLVKKIRNIPKDQKRKRVIYSTLLISLTALFISGPHRNPRVGEIVKVRKWRLWKSWMRFFAFEVVADDFDSVREFIDKQAIVGISPHGLFPFGLAFAALSENSQIAFGRFRAVVASATQMIPWVRDVLRWVKAVDASRGAVDRALSEGSRIGLAPGGIADMFEGYPKPLTHRNEEYIIIRKGIFKMAMKYRIPLIPTYCFGNSKVLRRVELPQIVQKVSLMFRVSLVLFFGQFGMPIPFRQRLLYVMGTPIAPPNNEVDSDREPTRQLDEFVNSYCAEIMRIFERHKESYGWASKTLKILKL